MRSSLICGLLAVSVAAAPSQRSSPVHHVDEVDLDIFGSSGYGPDKTSCPSSLLVRDANSVAANETAYYKARKPIADKALRAWLQKSKFSLPDNITLPAVGLTSSGGGLRALLSGAGVVKGLDSRDSNKSTSGLYQALSYHAGLSGGSWLLSSIAGNNWPTVSNLSSTLWESSFSNSLIDPEDSAFKTDIEIVSQLHDKDKAGFNLTLIDVWGRLLSYSLLKQNDGGAAETVSSLAKMSNFTSHNVPFPILTAIGVDTTKGECSPPNNGTQYEFTPFEFGSWDKGVNAFTQIRYLGSSLSNGKPVSDDDDPCVTGFDNLGFSFGTSSDIFAGFCEASQFQLPSDSSFGKLEQLLNKTLSKVTQDVSESDEIYALYPNPFRNYDHSSMVSNMDQLTLVDGGLSNQNNPVWPFLHRPEVDVLFVNDNSADTAHNFPNGSEILVTYQQAKAQNLTRMPFIPSVDTFVKQKLNQRPTFFGCNNTEELTIIYLPNFDYSFPSNESTFKATYNESETTGMITNSVAVADYNGNSTWAECLACGIMESAFLKEKKALPTGCSRCFDDFCYFQA